MKKIKAKRPKARLPAIRRRFNKQEYTARTSCKTRARANSEASYWRSLGYNARIVVIRHKFAKPHRRYVVFVRKGKNYPQVK